MASHASFYVAMMLIFCTFGVLGFIFSLLADTLKGKLATGAVFVVIWVGIFAVSAKNEYSQVPPKNQAVTGEFKGYMTEGYRAQSGKSKADFHYLYVVYKVPEGEVVMLAAPGTIYPPLAVLYKN